MVRPIRRACIGSLPLLTAIAAQARIRLTLRPQARGLSPLVNLTSLDISNTGVTNLFPLFGMTKLTTLNCSGCELDDVYLDLWMMPSLDEVYLHEAILPGVPPEVLSKDDVTSCLESLRAHFKDLGEGGS